MIDYTHKMTVEEKLMVSKAFFHIGRMQETKPAVDFLAGVLDNLDAKNRREENNRQYRVNQGACQALEDILRLIVEARDKFADFDEIRRKQTP